MNRPRKYFILGFLFCAMTFTLIGVNHWVAQELRQMSLQPAPFTPAPTDKSRDTAAAMKPRPVFIDPLSDPLAPVVPAKISSHSSAPEQKMKPKKVYEGRVEDPILVQ